MLSRKLCRLRVLNLRKTLFLFFVVSVVLCLFVVFNEDKPSVSHPLDIQLGLLQIDTVYRPHKPSRQLFTQADEKTQLENKLLDITSARNPNLLAFQPALTQQDRGAVLQILETVINYCNYKTFDCMMYGDLLLGSYRFHNLLPWSDQFTLLVLMKHKTNFELTLLRSETIRFDPHKAQVYSLLSESTKYLQIVYFDFNQKQIWFLKEVYDRSLFLPMHHRPISHLLIPAPADSYGILTQSGTSKDCQSEWRTIPCKLLEPYYSFVEREPAIRGIRENLVQRNLTVSGFIIMEPSYALTKRFSLELITGVDEPKP